MNAQPAERRTSCLGVDIASRIWSGASAEEGGTPDQVIVALHGWQDNAASFDALGQALAQHGPENWTLHALDLPGHGESNHLPASQSYNLWDYVHLVNAYVSQLSGPVWLCGHSLGGMVATLLAALQYDYIRGLLTLDMLGMAHDKPEEQTERLIRTLQAQHQSVPQGRPSPSFGHAVERRQRSGSPRTWIANAALVQRGAVEQQGQWWFRLDPRVRLGSVIRLTEPQVLAVCRRVQCPWNAVLGKEGLYTEDFVARLQPALPQVDLHWWSGGHHFHMENEPEALWQWLCDTILTAGKRQ